MAPSYLKKIIFHKINRLPDDDDNADGPDIEDYQPSSSGNNWYGDWVINSPNRETSIDRSEEINSISFLLIDSNNITYDIVEHHVNRRIDEIMISRSNSNNDSLDLNESKVDVNLHDQQIIPLTTSINYTLLKETLKTTSDLMVTNHDISSKEDDNIQHINDLPLDSSLNNKSKLKNEESSFQLNQSAQLAEENIVLLSLDNNEKIVLSKVQSVPQTENLNLNLSC